MDIKGFKIKVYNLLTDITTNVFCNTAPTSFDYDTDFTVYDIENGSGIYTLSEFAGSEVNVTINYHSKDQVDLDTFLESLIGQFKNEDHILRFNNSTQFFNNDLQMNQLTVIYRGLL